jgi:MYXO-CTERM domain-containing protein
MPSCHTRLATVSLVAALTLTAVPAAAKTYHLSSSGSDSTGDGSAAKPWKTFTYAGTKLLPGDTLEVGAGTYSEQVKLTQLGLKTDPVTVKAATGAKVVLDGKGTLPASKDDGLVQIEGDYITVQGLEKITGSKGSGVYLSGKNNTLVSCTIHDNQQLGIYFFSTTGGLASKNKIYQNVLMNKAHTASAWENGVGLYKASGVIIEGNTIYNNHGEGLAISLGKDNVARGNTLYDNLHDNLLINNTQTARVEGNMVYATKGSGFEVAGKRPNGIVIGDTDYGSGSTASGNQVLNNIVTGCDSNLIWFNTKAAGSGLKSGVIAHNTLVQAVSAAIVVDSGAHSSSTVANNIVVQSAGVMITIASVSGLTFTHNNWLGGAAGLAASKDDVAGNCKLADLNKTTPDGFKIDATSPCRDKAKVLSGIAKDFFGTPRPQGAGPDVGAHEYTTTAPPADGGPTTDSGGTAADSGGAGQEAGSTKDAVAVADITNSGSDGGVKPGDGEDDGCGCGVGRGPAAPLGALVLLFVVIRLSRRIATGYKRRA